jgi:signal transduction histidine kinase
MQHETARIIVQDTGIGIAAEHLPHIFERFYRGDQARQKTARSSSGLGLAIVDWIIQAHGGSVAVESTIGRGSTFTIILPAG